MLKIQSIKFIKVEYDDSIPHNIFSIANITFSNFEPIYGALLYWHKNDSPGDETPEGDFKFFYDMATVKFYASVKFPSNVRLSKAERQELTFILLEERGSVGSYSFSTSSAQKKDYDVKKQFKKLHFPVRFNKHDFGELAYFEEQAIPSDELIGRYIAYDRAFVKDYLQWRYYAARLHPDDLKPYLDYIDFNYVCFANIELNEQFLIEHLHEIDFMSLQFNRDVLARLSQPFKAFLIEMLQQADKPLHVDFKGRIEDFIQDDTFYEAFGYIRIPRVLDMDEENVDYNYFEFDIGSYRWSGCEHLITGIPSFACQLYDEEGYRKRTHKEMDAITKTFTEQQWLLYSAHAELHWLHKYRKKMNWSYVCQYNPNLTEEFLIANMKWLDFQALGLNTRCYVSEEFLITYMNKFNHTYPIPLILSHLTEYLYVTYKDQLKVDINLLFEYIDQIDVEEFKALQQHIKE